MHHDGGYAARHHAVTVRHRDGEVFVRCQDRPWNCNAGLRRLRISFYERRKIGPGVAEQIVDPAIGQQRQIGRCDIAGWLRFGSARPLQARFHGDALQSWGNVS
jgi:hypothetical protein